MDIDVETRRAVSLSPHPLRHLPQLPPCNGSKFVCCHILTPFFLLISDDAPAHASTESDVEPIPVYLCGERWMNGHPWLHVIGKRDNKPMSYVAALHLVRN